MQSLAARLELDRTWLIMHIIHDTCSTLRGGQIHFNLVLIAAITDIITVQIWKNCLRLLIFHSELRTLHPHTPSSTTQKDTKAVNDPSRRFQSAPTKNLLRHYAKQMGSRCEIGTPKQRS